eukprot:INCI14345.3.p1 GENE.INCI14345.3~~INCI14345.3.p1  ORF type:complete len:233 (-),score=50.60 INCI14345.3:224-922(-)
MDRAMLESYIKRQVKKVKKKSDIEAEPATQKVEYSQLANHEKRKFVKAEEQGHTIRIAVRFYQIKKPVTEQHSYIVGVEMGGLSEEISTILEVSRAASFKELRTAIEVKKDRGMVRRTMTFQALRHFMELCTNHHKYSEKRRRTEYRIAVMESDDADVPTLLSLEDEEKLPLTSIPIFESYRTVVLVPVSQVCPVTDEITAIVHEAPEDQLALEDANSEVNNGGGGSAADID